MKKTTVCVMIILIFLMFALLGCSNNIISKSGLSLNKKYIDYQHLDDSEDLQSYYIFYQDGTAKFYRKEYTIIFKYFIVQDEDMVALFYDSHKYHPGYSEENMLSPVNTTNRKMYLCTKDFLALSNIAYICEDFLPQIPNFGK